MPDPRQRQPGSRRRSAAHPSLTGPRRIPTARRSAWGSASASGSARATRWQSATGWATELRPPGVEIRAMGDDGEGDDHQPDERGLRERPRAAPEPRPSRGGPRAMIGAVRASGPAGGVRGGDDRRDRPRARASRLARRGRPGTRGSSTCSATRQSERCLSADCAAGGSTAVQRWSRLGPALRQPPWLARRYGQISPMFGGGLGSSGVAGPGRSGARAGSAAVSGGVVIGEKDTRRPPSGRLGIRGHRSARKRKNPGDDLFSRKAALSVSSALESLTSVFGMGTGMASPLVPPGFRASGCRSAAGLARGPWTGGAPIRSSISLSQSGRS